MALSPINPTQLTPPRVAFIDERSGAISREWYRFFLSLLTATQTNQEETSLVPDVSSLLATYDSILASVAQTSETASNGMVTSLESSLINLQNAFGVTPPDLGGTVTSVAASGGLTGLTFTGSPITTSGTLTLGGTLNVAYGGTGQTSYTDGQLLIGNSTGNTLTKATLTAGANITITNGAGSVTIAATDAFTGTVTSVSVTSANGFAGTVANATTTPAITLSTTVTGLVKGNGTAISAASAGTDYVAPGAITSSGLTMATARLLGRTTASTGAVEEITVGTGLLLSGGSLSNSAPDQTVTLTAGTGISISGTYPSFTITNTAPNQIVSLTGAGTTVVTGSYPNFTITSNDQYVGTVTSVSGTGSVNGITLTGTVTSSGSLTLGGTLSNVSLTTQVTGTLPVGNGGTGATTFTANGVLYGNTTSAVGVTAAGTTGQVLIGNTGAAPSWAALSSNAVTSISFGTTGLTPSTATQGAVTVAGTLAVANGGTGTATAFTTGSVVFAGASGVYSQSNANFFWDNTNARLGLGTTGPSQRLHVRQDLNGTIGVLIQNRNGSGTPIAAVQFVTGGLDLSDDRYAQITAEGGGSTIMKFWTSNGGAPTAKLTIAAGGSLTALGVYDNTVGATNRDVFVDNTGLIGYVPSILASKTEVNDLTDASWLYSLRPVSFHYRKRDENGLYTDEAEIPLEYGLIAEDVETINPELVFYDETPKGLELRGVSYSKLIIPILAELQALRSRVAELEKAAAL